MDRIAGVRRANIGDWRIIGNPALLRAIAADNTNDQRPRGPAASSSASTTSAPAGCNPRRAPNAHHHSAHARREPLDGAEDGAQAGRKY